MAEKKYFWLRLQKDFFKRHDIRIIESMPNGKDYILFYLKLLVESVSHEGQLRFSDTIPYSDEMLSTITNTNIDMVRAAMAVFTELEMIEILEDSTIYMNEVEKMIGFETAWAQKKREYRDKQRTLSLECPSDVRQEIEINKEIEKELEIDIKKKKPVRHHHGEYANVLLSDEELDKLQAEFPNDYLERIDNLSRYMRSTGKSYKDHLATIRNWARRDAEKKPKKQGDYMKADYDMAALEQQLLRGN